MRLRWGSLQKEQVFKKCSLITIKVEILFSISARSGPLSLSAATLTTTQNCGKRGSGGEPAGAVSLSLGKVVAATYSLHHPSFPHWSPALMGRNLTRVWRSVPLLVAQTSNSCGVFASEPQLPSANSSATGQRWLSGYLQLLKSPCRAPGGLSQ